MRKFHREQYEMAKATISFLLDNKEITKTFPEPYNVYLANAQTIIAKIHDNEAVQVTTTAGITDSKNQLRIVLETSTLDMALMIMTYAKFVKNAELIREVEYTKSKLQKLSAETLISTCQSIHTIAIANKTALAPYGVTDALIAALQTNINNFDAAKTKARKMRDDKDETTEEQIALITELMDIFKNMDVLIAVYRNTLADFFNRYKIARMLVSEKTTTLSLIATAKDSLSLLRLPNVSVLLKFEVAPLQASLQNAMQEEERFTGEQGQVKFSHIAQGTYTLIAKKLGYKTITMKVYIITGERSDIDLLMVPE